MRGESAFGVDHGGVISKAETAQRDRKKQATGAAVGAAGVGATGVAATRVKIPEHSHYDKKTRKHLRKLPAGVHEVDTAMLAKKPRKLGARKQQAPYVAAMAQERPTPYSPVPITRYAGDKGMIQRDNAHSVMANAMKGRKTTIKLEDAPGHRPTRRLGEEVVRRGQSRYQQRRLKRHTNLSEEAVEGIRAKYKPSSRIKNTTKRPHGMVEEGFKQSMKPYNFKTALGLVRKDRRDRDLASGAAGAAGVGALGATPVRRSASKVDVSGGRMSAKDTAKVVSPGYRPGNKRAIRTMARNLGSLEKQPTTVVRFKDDKVLPFDGNHRATARLARGDKSVPVKVIEGGERPAVSVTRNAYHGAQQKLHQSRMKRGVFAPTTKTGKHSGPTKTYAAIANASPTRSGRRKVDLGSTRAASGPTKAALRTRQGVALTAGTGLLGTAHHLRTKKD